MFEKLPSLLGFQPKFFTGGPSRFHLALLHDIEQRGSHVRHFELEEERDRRVITLELEPISEELVAGLSDLDYVIGARWHR